MDNKTKYHDPDSCNKCAGKNDLLVTCSEPDSDLVYEYKTKCTDCGFGDYWAYGFFESSKDKGMVSKCDTYSFDHEG